MGWLASGLASGPAPDTVVLTSPTPSADSSDELPPFRVLRAPGLRQLWRLIGRADVVHLAGPVLIPMLMARVRGRVVVVEHHAYQAICPNGLLWHAPTQSVCPGHFAAGRYHECLSCNRPAYGSGISIRMLLTTFVRQWLARGVAANVAVSEHLRQRIAMPRSLTILHGAPSVNLAFAPASSSTSVFAYVGRLVDEKGLVLLLEALRALRAQHPLVELRVIGDGPQRPRLEALVRAWSLEHAVRFSGWLQGAPLESALRDVLAVVVPSLWEESAGLVAVEQMLRGRLVIAAKTGGLAEIVDDGGWLFERGNIESLTVCMERAIRDPQAVAHGRTRARHRATSLFAKDRMVDEHRALYARLVSSPSS